MIQANELRLGNYILDSSGTPIKVTPQRIADIDNKLVVANPIPLTEEILLKCGFKCSKHSKEWILIDIGRYYFEVNINTIGLINIGIDDKNESYEESIDGIKCEYLHDLQNKIFSISGKELEINL